MGGELFRICGLAVLCLAASLLLARMGGEFVGLVRLGGSVLLFGVLIFSLSEILEELRGLFSASGAEKYADRMIRALGLAFLTAICSDLCRDTGESTLANGVEMAGKLAIVWLSPPLVAEIMATAAEILEIGA